MVALGHVVTAVTDVTAPPVAVVGCPGGSGGSRVPSGMSSGRVTLPLPGSCSWKLRAGNGICPFLPVLPQNQGSGTGIDPCVPSGDVGQSLGTSPEGEGSGGPQKEISEKRKAKGNAGNSKGQDPGMAGALPGGIWDGDPENSSPRGLWGTEQGMVPVPKNIREGLLGFWDFGMSRAGSGVGLGALGGFFQLGMSHSSPRGLNSSGAATPHPVRSAHLVPDRKKHPKFCQVLMVETETWRFWGCGLWGSATSRDGAETTSPSRGL